MAHNDSSGESASPRVERASSTTSGERATFSGSEIRDLHASYNDTVGAGNAGMRAGAGAGGDANLPSHLSFDNSIYSGVHGAVGSDGSFKVASLSDSPAAPPSADSPTRVENQYLKEAGNFAYGDTVSGTDAQAGKDKLQTLTQSAFQNGGVEGLKDLASRLNDQGLEKYGDDAFKKAGPEFDQSIANMKVTPNKDGTTQVQYDFAQPNSPDKNTVIFQLPKNELGTVHPEVFPDSGKETYKI